MVEIHGEKDIALRSELIKRRLAFERDPEAFAAKWQGEENALKARIKRAQDALPGVKTGDDMYLLAAKIGAALGVDGHRADITLLKTAETLAAFYGDESVARSHIVAAAPLVLPHRLRRTPFDVKNGLPPDWEAMLDA